MFELCCQTVNPICGWCKLTPAMHRYCYLCQEVLRSIAFVCWLVRWLTFDGIEYLANSWIQRLGSNGPTAGNGIAMANRMAM